MAKKDEQGQDAQAQKSNEAPAQEEQVVAAPMPDASHYVLQPTSEKLNVDVLGDMPKDRFQEEVLKGSDADSGSGVDAHPLENQPAYGVTADNK